MAEMKPVCGKCMRQAYVFNGSRLPACYVGLQQKASEIVFSVRFGCQFISKTIGIVK
jgi:hypothetical protein